MQIQRLDVYMRETFKGRKLVSKEDYPVSIYAESLTGTMIRCAFEFYFGLYLAGDTYETKAGDAFYFEFSEFGLMARYYFIASPYEWEPEPPKVYAYNEIYGGNIETYVFGPDIVSSGDVKFLGRNTGLTLNNKDLYHVYKDDEKFSYRVDLKRRILYKWSPIGYYLTEATEEEKLHGKLPDIEKVFNPATTESHPDNNFHQTAISLFTNTRVVRHRRPNTSMPNSSDIWGGFFGGVYLGGGFDDKDK